MSPSSVGTVTRSVMARVWRADSLVQRDGVSGGGAGAGAVSGGVVCQREPEPGPPVLGVLLGVPSHVLEGGVGRRSVDTSGRPPRQVVDGQPAFGVEGTGQLGGTTTELDLAPDEEETEGRQDQQRDTEQDADPQPAAQQRAP